MTSPGIWGRKIYFCVTLLYRRNSIQTLGVYISIMLLLLLWWIKATSPRVSNIEDHFTFSCQCCIQRGHRAPGRWRGLPEIIMQVINGKSEFFLISLNFKHPPTTIHLWIWNQFTDKFASHGQCLWSVIMSCAKDTCVHAQSLSFVQLSATPWTVACQVPLSMGFTRQISWSQCPFPPPGHLPELSYISCIGRQILYHSATWKAFKDANGILLVWFDIYL